MSHSCHRRERGGGGGGRRYHRAVSANAGVVESQPKVAAEDSPFHQMFSQFQVEIDQRHEKYEKLVKFSRDITIESKKLIFLLHRIDSDESREKILTEVKQKLDELRNSKWRLVAVELVNEEPYQFLRAYSPGLQEYIEAMSFFYYLENRALLTLQQVEQSLTFTEEVNDKDPEDGNHSGDRKDSSESAESKTLSVCVPFEEYMLGLADLTGEMMRLAIGCIGRGEFEAPFELCKYIQMMHNAFLSYSNYSRALLMKFGVLRQSMRKVEDACYTLKVRGSEMPKHLLVDSLNSTAATGLPFEPGNELCPE